MSTGSNNLNEGPGIDACRASTAVANSHGPGSRDEIFSMLKAIAVAGGTDLTYRANEGRLSSTDIRTAVGCLQPLAGLPWTRDSISMINPVIAECRSGAWNEDPSGYQDVTIGCLWGSVSDLVHGKAGRAAGSD